MRKGDAMSTALWQLMGGESPQVLVQRCLDEMKRQGIVRLEADYSGGNDEGGVQQVRLFQADGTEVEGALPWKKAEGDHLEYDESSLWGIAESILGTEFGSWAGEFYASGTLYVDPTHDPKCWRKGEYEVPSSHEDYEEYA
jgi:hypothetical protein